MGRSSNQNQGDHNKCQFQKVAQIEEEKEQKGEEGVGGRGWAGEAGQDRSEQDKSMVLCDSELAVFSVIGTVLRGTWVN